LQSKATKAKHCLAKLSQPRFVFSYRAIIGSLDPKKGLLQIAEFSIQEKL